MKASARAIWQDYSAHTGADQIASEFAVAGLWWWCGYVKPFGVLEFGPGVGTLTEVILSRAECVHALLCVEHNEWCRRQIEVRFGKRVSVLESSERLAGVGLAPWSSWDLVVVDDRLTPDDARRGAQGLHRRSAIFVEGGRRDDRARLRTALHCWYGMNWTEATWRPWDRTKGYSVILCEPTWWERLWFALVRAREGVLDLAARAMGMPVGKKRR